LMYSVNVCYYSKNEWTMTRALSRAFEIGKEIILGFAE
jgi:hypothetical protein